MSIVFPGTDSKRLIEIFSAKDTEKLRELTEELRAATEEMARPQPIQ